MDVIRGPVVYGIAMRSKQQGIGGGGNHMQKWKKGFCILPPWDMLAIGATGKITPNIRSLHFSVS